MVNSTMNINATLINYRHPYHRKLWLHAHAIRMVHTSDSVAEGKLLGETSYPQRATKNQELEISAEVFTDKYFPSKLIFSMRFGA